MKDRVVVIGAVNMDIGGSPAGELILRDSNPGQVTIRPGGVGRNIAHDLCLLGLQVSLIAAVGGDMYGQAILDSCRSLGMDMSMAPVMPEHRSSSYLYVTDENGDMHIGISDMEITKCITPEYLAPFMDRINQASAVVMDANLQEETIRFVAENCTAPIYVDPVSTVKAMRIKNVLHRLSGIKPNAIEACSLSGRDSAQEAALALVEKGVKRVFVSMGEEGMIAADGSGLLRLPCVSAKVINTTGAGDAAMAAIVWAGVKGLDLESSARAALRAGALTTECVEANNPLLANLFKEGV